MTPNHRVSGARAYMHAVRERLDAIASQQLAAIEQAAAAIAEAIERGGMVYLFGTGHSHMLAEEGHYRAGGFASVCPILYSGLMLHAGSDISGKLERMVGLASEVLARYQPTAQDVMMIFSNSGVNSVPVEMAQQAREIGMTVIAVVAQDYAAQIPTGPTGHKLADLADIVIDNGGVPGDALVALGSSGLRVGPLSTIAGAYILNAVLVEAAWRLHEKGIALPIYRSGNMPGADEHNTALIEAYRSRNPYL